MNDKDPWQDFAGRATIDLSEPAQVNFWCHKFRCSESQLRDAVERVGTAVARVEAFLD